MHSQVQLEVGSKRISNFRNLFTPKYMRHMHLSCLTVNMMKLLESNIIDNYQSIMYKLPRVRWPGGASYRCAVRLHGCHRPDRQRLLRRGSLDLDRYCNLWELLSRHSACRSNRTVEVLPRWI